MDGLTNIIAKINEQNDAECKAILDSANEKEQAVIEKAQTLARDNTASITEKYKTRAAIMNAKAQSGAELEFKRTVLAEKSRIIDNCINQALIAMCESPDEVYFGYFETLCISNALSGVGKMKMSSHDLKRLPEGFEKKLSNILPKDKNIIISDETIDTVGGFVIEYPEMRVDCTFKSLIDDKIDVIRDSISSYLFA